MAVSLGANDGGRLAMPADLLVILNALAAGVALVLELWRRD